MCPVDLKETEVLEQPEVTVRPKTSAGRKFLAHALSIIICVVLAALFCVLIVRSGVSALFERENLISAANSIDFASVPLKYIPGVMPEIEDGTAADWMSYYFSPLGYAQEDLVELSEKLNLTKEAAKLISGYGEFILYGEECDELTKAYILDFLNENKSKICNTLSISNREFNKTLIPYIEDGIGDSLKPLRTIKIEDQLGSYLPLIRFVFGIWCLIIIAVLTALLIAAMTVLHKKLRPVLAYTGTAALIAGLLCLVPSFGFDFGLITTPELIPAVEAILPACLSQVFPTLYLAGFFFITIGVLAILWNIFIAKVRKNKTAK